jgi:hypothetical protein
MKIFQTISSTEEGDFFISAIHEEQKIKTLFIYPIEGGIIEDSIPLCHLSGLSVLVGKIQEILSEI